MKFQVYGLCIILIELFAYSDTEHVFNKVQILNDPEKKRAASP